MASIDVNVTSELPAIDSKKLFPVLLGSFALQFKFYIGTYVKYLTHITLFSKISRIYKALGNMIFRRTHPMNGPLKYGFFKKLFLYE